MATKKVIEKKTGEKYASKASMAKHEKKESKAEQMKEYGKVKRSPTRQMTDDIAKVPAPKKTVKSTTKQVEPPVKQLKSPAQMKASGKMAPTKMKKC
jgi:hypothetical protein